MKYYNVFDLSALHIIACKMMNDQCVGYETMKHIHISYHFTTGAPNRTAVPESDRNQQIPMVSPEVSGGYTSRGGGA